jgi:hypothetical protein
MQRRVAEMPIQILLTEDIVDGFQNFHDCEIHKFAGTRSPLSFTLDLEVKRKSIEYYNSLSSSGQNLVRIIFGDIESLRISDFNHQNVILNLSLVRLEQLYIVNISSSFGLEGEFKARKVELQIL